MKYIFLLIPLMLLTSCYFFTNKKDVWYDVFPYKYEEIAYIDTMCQRIMKNPEGFQKIIDSDDRFFILILYMLHIGATTFMSTLKNTNLNYVIIKLKKTFLIDVNGDSTTFGGCLLYKTKNNVYAMFDFMNKNNQVFFTIIDVREQRKCEEWNPYTPND
jgi:hypothetical protein